MIIGHPLRNLWIGVAVELVCIGSMTQHGDFLLAGEPTRFAVLAFMAGAAFWIAGRSFQELKLPPQMRARYFWVVAVVLRLAMLPILPGDDLWRYRWEGMIQLHGFNPYLLAPDSPALVALRNADWTRINHQNIAAIYPPLSQLMFAALSSVRLSVLGYKLLFALADLGVAAMVRSLLARRGTSRDCAVWYAWNPLAIYASAGAAHFDALMVVMMIGAAWSLDCLPQPPSLASGGSAWRVPRQAWVSALLLGLAIACKVVPAVLLPVWFFALGWRRALLALPVTIGLSPALALLYGFSDVPVFAGIGRFAREFQVNDALWWLLDPAHGLVGFHVWATSAVCLALAVWFRRDWRRGMLWVLGALLLLSPSVHAWYAIWILPVAVWRGATAWIVFSISVFGYYLLWEVNHASGRSWEEPLWLRLVIYAPPLLTLGWTIFARRYVRAKPPAACYQ